MWVNPVSLLKLFSTFALFLHDNLNIRDYDYVKSLRCVCAIIHRQSSIFWLLTKGKSLVNFVNQVFFHLTTEGSLVDKTDLLALYLSGTYCHKTSARPPSCQAPRQPTIHTQMYKGLCVLHWISGILYWGLSVVWVFIFSLANL